VKGGSRCEQHARPKWSTTPAQVKRITGRKLQARRRALFSREPMCRVCASKGLLALAVIRDHIIPLAEGGEDTDENTQPLCQACSDGKTAEEARRGRAGRKSR